jgi:hypothetical protein
MSMLMLQYCTQNFLEGLKKTIKDFSQGSLSLAQNSNRELLEHEAPRECYVHSWSIYPSAKGPRYPQNRRQGGPGGEEKQFWPLRETVQRTDSHFIELAHLAYQSIYVTLKCDGQVTLLRVCRKAAENTRAGLACELTAECYYKWRG